MLEKSLLDFNNTDNMYLRSFTFVVYGGKELYNKIIDFFEE